MADIVQPRLSQLSRRDLLAGGAVAGTGAVAIVAGKIVLGSGRSDHGDDTVQFISDATPGSDVSSSPQATSSPSVATAEKVDPATILESATIVDLRDGMTTGAFTAVELVEAVLQRIERFDRSGPELAAVIETVGNARELAQAADDERVSGLSVGPLHGIPILVKDIIATEDDTRTAAGSIALEDNIVVRDAFLVTQLRNAGAIVLGKANMTEWSNFKGDGGASGWSPRGGQTRNPYDPELSPSGSSSGSAVSVAAGYVPAAIGSETNGSIIAPAAVCGVVGLKPTAGLVSRTGVIPLSLSQDSPGPMTKTVEDAAIMLSVLAGYDAEDILNGQLAEFAPAAQFEESPIPEPGAADYTRALDPDALNGARIGVCRTLFWFDEQINLAVEETLELMSDAGAEIIDDVRIGTFEELESANYSYTIYTTELKHGLASYLETFTPDGPIQSIADVVAFNIDHADEELPFGGETAQYALIDARDAGLTLESPEYLDTLALHTSLAREDGIDAVMDEFELDVLIAPTGGLPTPIDNEGDTFAGASSTLAAFAGYPSITIPIGDIDGLPIGIHIFGRAFSEETILGIAYATEQILPKRIPPRLSS